MAGKNERELKVNIIGDARQMKKATKEAETGIQAFEKALGKAGSALTAAFAGGAILNFAKQSVTAALEDQRAQERLAKTLKNVTAANRDQVAAVEASIKAMQSQFAVADDELRPAFETIVRATKDVGQAQQLLRLALDISAGSGKGLQEVSVALIKAMGGQTRGLKDLGISLKDTSGKALSFDDIVSQLTATFAGQAEELAGSQVGKLKAVGIQYDELKETVGMALLPALSQLAGVAAVLFGWFNSLDSGTQKFISQIVIFGGIAFTAVKAFTAIKAAVVGMNLAMGATPWGAIALGVGALSAVILGSGKSASVATRSYEKYREAIEGAGDAAEDALRKQVLTLVKEGYLKEAVDKTNLSYLDAAKYVLGYSNELKNADSKLLMIGGKVKSVAGFLSEQRDALKRARDEVKREADELLNLGKATVRTSDYFLGLTNVTTDLKEESKWTAEQLEEFSQKMWSTGESASEMARSIIGAVDDIRSQFDVNFKVDKLKKDVKEGLKSLADDLRGLKKGSDEYNIVVQERVEKELELAEALADQQIQSRKLNEAEAGIARNQTMISYFSDVLKRLEPNSPLRKYLNGFIDDLLKIDGTYDARINVTVAGMPGVAASDIRGNNFGLTPDQVNQILATIKPRAMGGPVASGRAYVVGEQGPELFVPSGNGQIVPNDAGVSGLTNITVNVTAPTGTDPYTWGNAIVSALKSYVRVNGKIAGLTV